MKFLKLSYELLKHSDWDLIVDLLKKDGITVMPEHSGPNGTFIVPIEGEQLKEPGQYDVEVFYTTDYYGNECYGFKIEKL